MRYFAEKQHIVFFWKLPRKGACDVLLMWMLERTCDVWKGYKNNPKTVDGTVTSVFLATLC